MIRILMLITFFTATSSLLQAQLTWNFTAATATGSVTNITTVSNVTQGNNNGTTTFLAAGLPASSVYTGFSAGFNGSCCARTGVLSTIATTGSAYIQVVLTPAAGYAVNISSIKWGNFSIPTTGPTTLSIYASNDNFATATPVVTLPTVTPNAAAWTFLSSTTGISGLTGTAVTIRIYASGGTGTVTAGVANWRVDDLVITATAQAGTAGQIPKYTGATTFANSIITENNNNIGIGTTTPTEKLDINGNLKFNGVLLAGTTPTGGIDGQFLKSTGPTTAPVWFTAPAGSAGWGLTGNTGTVPGTNFIGTIDAQRLVFKTGGAENATILTGGNMGIGTATPATKLDVNGSITTNAGLLMKNGAPVQIWNSANTNFATISSFDNGGYKLITGAGAATGITVLNLGNVGIGTQTPAAKLDIAGNIKITDGTQGANKVLTSDANGLASWQAAPAASTTAWGLTGNFGTNPSSNFIGTTDDNDLLFKRFGQKAGIITQTNTSFGFRSLNPASTGNFNTSIGVYSMFSNTTGSNNVAAGDYSLYYATTASYNTAIGYESMKATVTGVANSAFGVTALAANVDGSYNVAIGQYALSNATTSYNVAIGSSSLQSTTSGHSNVGIGTYSLFQNNTGTHNVAIGQQALNSTKGSKNVGLGAESIQGLINGVGNIGLGFGSGSNLTGGDNNIFIGNAVQPNVSNTASNQLNIGNWIYGKNGSIGIGVTNPAEKLDVNGNIYTTGKILIGQTNTAAVAPYALAVNGWAIFTKATVKLNVNWPDYVFEPAYNLPTLAEVEAYLTRYKHLPDMPSAVAVKEKGIDLGDNQTILVKKVEELTLYLIALNKKVEALAKENEELKKKVNQDKQ